MTARTARRRHGPRAAVAASGDFVWVGLHEPTEDELRGDRRRRSACTRWPSRTPSTPTSGPSSSATATRSSSCSRRSGTSTSDDAVETGEINHLRRPRLRRHRAARRGRRAAGRPARARGASRRCSATARSRCVYAVCDQVVDDYEEVAGRARGDVDEVEASVFSAERTNDSARIYTLKREIARGPPRGAAAARADAPVRAAAPCAASDAEAAPFFRDVADHLARVAETVDTLDPAVDGVRRPPGADLGAAERRHAQDLGRRRAGRRARP